MWSQIISFKLKISTKKPIIFKSQLLDASEEGNFLSIRFLLDKSDQDPNLKRKFGSTALHLACYGGYFEIFQFLVLKNANINEKNKHGETALHLACQRGHFEIVKLLVLRNVNINEKDIKGQTALMFAELRGPSYISIFLKSF